MGSKIAKYDFSAFKEAMLAKGISKDEVENWWGDLLILLHAVEDTGRAHAMSEGADKALHEITSDTAALLSFSARIFGGGSVLVHDPRSYGTSAFDDAWENSRAAFREHGIDVAADYRSDVGSFRSAATCLVNVCSIADLQAT